MGGSAFNASLPSTAFPRLSPAVYQALKARLTPKLKELYSHVGVPLEAPEKKDHGDLDFLVARPKSPNSESDYLPHEVVQSAIGATHLVPMGGNRTSNYAVPVATGEWIASGHAEDEALHRSATEDGQIYYQVDVHACEDKKEWDRIMFYHSYGDLGMILGLIARNAGLKLGVHGLQLLDIPNPPFHLSTDFNDITQFLGLSFKRYQEAFTTKLDIFKWAGSCKYFDGTRFRTSGPGISKVKPDRLMYAQFVEWVEETRLNFKGWSSSAEVTPALSREEKYASVRREALVFFKKQEAFDALVRERENRTKLKGSFRGSSVRDWAGLGEYWKGVKMIMDEVRTRLGGEDGVLEFLNEHGEDELKELVLQVKADLGIKDVVDAQVSVLTSTVGEVSLSETVAP